MEPGTVANVSRPRKRKRRVRSPHPGVVLIPPDSSSRHPYWRARFRDPDSGKTTKVRLDPAALGTAEGRREWAIRKSKSLAKRKMELETGAPRATGQSLKDAIERFFEAHPRLRPRTVAIYRRAADKLLEWAKGVGIKSADELTRGRLLSFRESLVKAPKQVAVEGGKRGEWSPGSAPRSARAINHELGSVRTVLRYLRDADLLPLVSHDDLRRSLKMEKVLRDAPEFMRPSECRSLVEAALSHDAATFSETREEHAGERPMGTTPRYAAIAPLVAFCLLSGARAGEAFALKWADIELEAADADGQVVGQIHLRASATKTGHARTIGMAVSPSLRHMLKAMAEHATGTFVFGGKRPMAKTLAEASRRRLVDDYGAPEFSWQTLRSTCATIQCNAPSIFGDAAAFSSAKRLGHSIVVSEKHYAGLFAVSRDARTLEQAMQIADVMDKVVAAACVPRRTRTSVRRRPPAAAE